ncbi:MSMEG_4193 family putative phosphomutase [Mumia zhuanghuii]|uniref:MSMEG_4193 family putative phosphomutase n=2 Tax=Mumia TaxID=1546255 RepID=A0ABW1QMA5_9ACTN|nr:MULTISPECIES: MSMEG_4193 family putative phosphomutase [Mumia]KAA1419907.1 MSMEG_4193 family putative phosphomutase [Mumia zhuanghuii]
MPTLILVRHGRTAANADGILAGRTRGIGLDTVGQKQAKSVGKRLAAVPLSLVVSSPLLRTTQTAREIVAAQAGDVAIRRDGGFVECGYGRWTGRKLSDLAKEPLWSIVQRQPSAAIFPGGEGLAEMAARATDAVRRFDRQVARNHGARSVWAAVSHGDVIKAIIADALGLHLDLFQRISVAPGSVSVISYGMYRATVHHVNDLGSDLSALARQAEAPPSDGDDASADGVPRGDAPVGGGS